MLKARAIAHRLYQEMWASRDYDLQPQLTRLRVPTLILQGDSDLIPCDCAAHIAEALPDARLVILSGCGHFAYLDRPDKVLKERAAFLPRS
jgi:pimeloyl-ACP methyl ester carboxylesterase